VYFLSKTSAEKAETEIQEFGFTTVVRPPVTGSDWLCLASKPLIPTAEELSKARQLLDALCYELHGEYDGWEAKIEK
jgi:hypothetical protein